MGLENRLYDFFANINPYNQLLTMNTPVWLLFTIATAPMFAKIQKNIYARGFIEKTFFE